MIKIFGVETTDGLTIDNGKGGLVTGAALPDAVLDLQIERREILFELPVDLVFSLVMLTETNFHGPPQKTEECGEGINSPAVTGDCVRRPARREVG